jgi:hypothetical protein
MKECTRKCVVNKKECTEKQCRAWIDYKKDFNCSNIAIKRHGNMTLAEIATRLNLSIVRIKQIQDKALQKLRKKRHLKAF